MAKAKRAVCAFAVLWVWLLASPSMAAPAQAPLSLSLPPTAPDALSALVDRYTAWRGGVAFKAVTSIHETGVFDESGLHGTYEDWTADQQWRSQSSLGGMTMVAVATPQRSWATSTSGQILDDPDAYESEHRLNLIEFGDGLRGGGGATATLAAPEQVNGRSWSVVHVSFGDNDTYDAFIDPVTGALGGFRFREKGQLTTETFSDWRWVDGVRMAFAETDLSDSDGTTTSKTDRIELNHPLDPALFGPPPAVHKASFANGATSTGWIDFEFYGDRQIFFPVKVNGHDTLALLDNGAFASFLDTSYAASIGLSPIGAFNTPGTGGVGTSGRIGDVDIQVGAMTLRDLTVGALDFATLARGLHHPLPVILGDEAFNELIVDIDFAHHRIAFHDPATFSLPPGAVHVPVVRQQGSRLVALSLDGGAPALFAIDLGDASALDVSPAYADEHKLLQGRLALQGRGMGVGGMTPDATATLNTVEFAGMTFNSVPATFPQAWPSATYTDKVHGLLGVGILSRFRLIIDWAHDGLYVIPNADAISTPFSKDRLGLWWGAVDQDSDAAITYVAPNSPAAAAGFKVGERITMVNGRPVKTAGDPGVGPPGAEVTLVTRATSDAAAATTVRTVKLADYY